jgi:hypothetical protein
MKIIEQMSSERSWKAAVQSMQIRSEDESYSWTLAGWTFVHMYNSGTVDDNEHIRFVPTVIAGAVNCG